MPVSYQGLLSGLLDLTEQTYAPHPVWSGSTTKPVQFTPLPKKAAKRRPHKHPANRNRLLLTTSICPISAEFASPVLATGNAVPCGCP